MPETGASGSVGAPLEESGALPGNGILPAGGGPLHIYFVSLLIRLRSALGGNGILRSTALRSFLAAAVNLQMLLGLCSEGDPGICVLPNRRRTSFSYLAQLCNFGRGIAKDRDDPAGLAIDVDK